MSSLIAPIVAGVMSAVLGKRKSKPNTKYIKNNSMVRRSRHPHPNGRSNKKVTKILKKSKVSNDRAKAKFKAYAKSKKPGHSSSSSDMTVGRGHTSKSWTHGAKKISRPSATFVTKVIESLRPPISSNYQYNGFMDSGENTCQWFSFNVSSPQTVANLFLNAVNNMPALASTGINSQVIDSSSVGVKIKLLSATQHVDFTNTSSAICEMTIYECRPRYDILSSNPSNSFLTEFISGFAAVSKVNNQSLIGVTHPQSHATQSEYLVQRYNIVATKFISLNPGERFTYTIHEGTPRVVSQYLQANAPMFESFRDFTKYALFKIRGQIGGDAAHNGVVAPTRLAYNGNETYLYTTAILPKQISQVNYSGGADENLGFSYTAPVSLYNIDDAKVEAVISA